MTSTATSWSTQQLLELLAVVAALPDGSDMSRRAVEQVATSLEAEVGALVSAGGLVASVGFARGNEPVELLLEAAAGRATSLDVPGVGCCDVLVTQCEALPQGRLILARSGGDGFTQEERSLVRGMAGVLGMSLQARLVLEEERRLRQQSDEQVRENAALLTSLRERQALLERLSRIQRSISSRQPLQDVLNTIVTGAAELLGDEVVALRLLDPADPETMVTASSLGVPEDVATRFRRISITEGGGIGAQAIREQRLVCTDEYSGLHGSLGAFVENGIRTAMAAPVRQGTDVVGSLVVASRTAGRTYSSSEQEVLMAFAEHVGLALLDARTVEALHAAVDEATQQSLHDSLTGLPNRALFLDRLAHACERSARAGRAPFAVLFVDVDNFKLVNDSLGHPVGDQLLCAVAERISGAVRDPDTVARLGGDEFAVLLEEGDAKVAVTTAQRIIAALSRPFRLPGQQVHVGASVGAVTSTGHDNRADDLLRDADVAMYRAKSEGRGRCVLFEKGMRLRLQARTELETEMRVALQRNEFVVYYQPVIDLVLGRVVGTEALVRWEHPRRGLVPPAEFIPLAEETGLINELGDMVLREACRQTAAWHREGDLGQLSVSVNLSPRQIQSGTFWKGVQRALATSELMPSCLVLEITESLLVQDIESAAARLSRLKELGVRVAIDDFGIGYSSLSYLSHLPVDILKIDRLFVAGLGKPRSSGELAGAIVALADSLGLATVAEGVETPEQAAALTSYGCTRVQGYLYAAPLPAGVLPDMVRRVAAGPPAQRMPPDARTLRAVT